MYDLEQFGIGWRGALLRYLQSSKVKNGDIYQFGVWDGFSMQVLGALVDRLKYTGVDFYGFDIFTGMPAETDEFYAQRDKPGLFNLLKKLNVTNVEEAVNILKQGIRTDLPKDSDLTITIGLVQDTLPHFKIPAKPALYVDMDMDIYSPTKYALEYLVKNSIIVEGTIIGYDNWGQNYPNYDIYVCGESRAHKEICGSYEIACVQLLETSNKGQTAFEVTKIKK